MAARSAEQRAVAAARLQDAGLTLTEVGEALGGITKQRAGVLAEKGHKIVAAIAEAQALGEEEDIVADASSTTPEPVPVVSAIVTSRHGVLLRRRIDDKPPWAFIGADRTRRGTGRRRHP